MRVTGIQNHLSSTTQLNLVSHAPHPEIELRPSYRVELGDAFDLLRQLPKASVDLIVTSPPYWGHRTYRQKHNWGVVKEWEASVESLTPPPYNWYKDHGGVLGLEPLPEWFVFHLVEIFDAAHNCLKVGGSMWINIGDTYFARWSSIRQNGRQGLGNNPRQRRRTPMGGYRQEKQLLLIPARFAIAMQERRWILRNDLIWFKPNIPPRPERDRLRLSHEHFFHFVKRPKEGRPKYYYDISKVEPRATDVVTYNVRPGNGGHTATFPTELVRPRIESSCPPGGLVVDPFCGTGRALVVALETGRSVIGFDNMSDYVQLAKRACDSLA
ncbi:MAG TPA: site-specific DNA-methyltransferase [Candidatus Binatia bacterium]|jgi:DNA modification methylase|nr:site-specific DNA-methyltransferase [Candidatus Binatia bacterium]